MSDRRPTGRRDPSRRIFAAFLVISVAAHATALIALSPPVFEKSPSPHAALEVVILAPTPLVDRGKPAATSRAVSNPDPMPFPSAASGAPRSVSREPIIAFRNPDPDERQSDPVVSAFPDPPAADNAESEPKRVTTAVTAPSFNAAYLSNPAPRYPDAARTSGVQGTVTLRVQVARDGVASSVAVEKSSGSPHLDTAALEAVRAWRFAPARRGGEAIESWMLVPIRFRLENPS